MASVQLPLCCGLTPLTALLALGLLGKSAWLLEQGLWSGGGSLQVGVCGAEGKISQPNSQQKKAEQP